MSQLWDNFGLIHMLLESPKNRTKRKTEKIFENITAAFSSDLKHNAQ